MYMSYPASDWLDLQRQDANTTIFQSSIKIEVYRIDSKVMISARLRGSLSAELAEKRKKSILLGWNRIGPLPYDGFCKVVVFR